MTTIFCPNCHSANIKKNGHIHNGKQNYRCKNCGRQFVRNPENKRISDETKEVIQKLLLAREASPKATYLLTGYLSCPKLKPHMVNGLYCYPLRSIT